MTKKKEMLTVKAKVVGLSKNDDSMGVVFDYNPIRQPFTVYFEVVDEGLDFGDLVTVTIMKSEVQDG